MPSSYETFWEHERFAVVGHSAERTFPKITYNALKKLGKTVYPVDPSADEIEGDPAFRDLADLPEQVEAVVLEVPKEETEAWVARVAEARVHHLWIHMKTDTRGALALAKKEGLQVRHGTCAVMYVKPGFSVHAIHRWIRKMKKAY